MGKLQIVTPGWDNPLLKSKKGRFGRFGSIDAIEWIFGLGRTYVCTYMHMIFVTVGLTHWPTISKKKSIDFSLLGEYFI